MYVWISLEMSRFIQSDYYPEKYILDTIGKLSTTPSYIHPLSSLPHQESNIVSAIHSFIHIFTYYFRIGMNPVSA